MRKLNLLAIALVGLGLNASVKAASISWSGASNINNAASDIATTGYMYKDALYATNGGANVTLGDTIFHGQTAASAGDYSTTDIRVQTNISNAAVTGTPPSTLFPTYSTVLDHADYGYGDNTNDLTNGTITLRNLTIGKGYQVQIWAVQRDGNFYVNTYTSGASVSLSLDPGQFTVGTFTADALTQVVKFETATGTNYYTVNAIALREVPEPASLGILGAGMAGLGLMRRRSRLA